MGATALLCFIDVSFDDEATEAGFPLHYWRAHYFSILL